MSLIPQMLSRHDSSRQVRLMVSWARLITTMQPLDGEGMLAEGCLSMTSSIGRAPPPYATPSAFVCIHDSGSSSLQRPYFINQEAIYANGILVELHSIVRIHFRKMGICRTLTPDSPPHVDHQSGSSLLKFTPTVRFWKAWRQKNFQQIGTLEASV
jgi:hypothetical protein